MTARSAYYLFSGLRMFAWGATATAYPVFQRFIGLSNTQIFLVEVLFTIGIICFEVPTGMFADGRGRASSLMLGVLATLCGVLAIGMADGFWSVLPGFLFIALGEAFLSGADQAWLKDAMTAEGGGDTAYADTLGRSALLNGMLMWAGGVIGAWSLWYTPRAQWFIGVACLFAAFIVVCMWMTGKGDPVHRVSEKDAFVRAVKALRGSVALRWAMCAGMIFPFFWTAHLQWQPKAYVTGGSEMLWIAWTAVCVAFALGGWLARSSRHPALSITSGLAMMSLSLWALSREDSFIPIVMGWLWAGRGMYDTAMNRFVQSRIESTYRATYGSLASVIGRISTMAIFLTIAYHSLGRPYAKAVDEAFYYSGFIMLGGVFLLLLFVRRIMQLDVARREVVPTVSE